MGVYMKNKNIETNESTITEKEFKFIGFFFDTSKIKDYFYEDEITKAFFDKTEIKKNLNKTIFSFGDIIDRDYYNDLIPYIIYDNICTVQENILSGNVFVISVEDIEIQIAIDIDSRLKKSYSPYIGMSSIDFTSSIEKRQFWKNLIREFSIQKNVVTYFGSKEEPLFSATLLKNKEFYIKYDNINNDWCNELHPSHQSNFIKSKEQLNILISEKYKNGDRDKIEMNFSLVQEVSIAGIQIWKAIEYINNVVIPKHDISITTDYIFMSLYSASQGIERLLKIILQLIMYSGIDESEHEKFYDLLLSHNHVSMFNFLVQKKNIEINKHCHHLLNILSDFYSKARYNRFKRNNDNKLELHYMQKFGDKINEDCFNEQLKHKFGKALGQLSQILYAEITKLSFNLGIYVYELDSQSVAHYALNKYFGNDLYETLKRIEHSKKELLFYLLKNADKIIIKMKEDLLPLEFEECDIGDYMKNLITNHDSLSMLHDSVSFMYDELVEKNKEKWKERIKIINNLI